MTKNEINNAVQEQIEQHIETIFCEMHAKFKTLEGAITPTQQIELDDLKSKLTALITTQVWQNTK